MLVVKIEVWPGGDHECAELIAEATAANVSHLAGVSDYHCRVSAKGYPVLGIEPSEAVFSVTGHERSAGVIELLRRMFYHAATRAKKAARQESEPTP